MAFFFLVHQVLLLMRNLSVNLTSPEFAEQVSSNSLPLLMKYWKINTFSVGTQVISYILIWCFDM